MEAFVQTCKKIVERYEELDQLLMDPAIIKDSKKLAQYGKEQAQLKDIVDVYLEYEDKNKQLIEANQLLIEKDAEMVALAKAEIEELQPQIQKLIARLELLLIPKDPDDDKNVIIEIRGAAGGDEGNIFAGDLYRLYTRYAEIKGWKVEILEAVEAEAGGYTLISFIVKGQDANKHFKFESGAHRVQRVPKTETQGRIHTSTATVLAMPEAQEEDIEINPDDLVIETHRASGAGGQHVNKTDSAVRITHVPTGMSVNVQDGRSQHENKANALKIIRARVYDYHQEKMEAEKGEHRRSKIGRGDRSEKIRTYNYPQNRLTDHRIGLTIVQLDRIMEGKLDDVIDALIQWEQSVKLTQNNGNNS